MAKSKNNVITFGLSGKVGDLVVFRQRHGQTIVAKAPEQSKNASPTQKDLRKRFQRATVYAKAAIYDPQTGEQYEAAAKKKKGISAYNVAVADFYHAPDIETFDLSSYKGSAGDEIRITVSDDFAVKSVRVKISKTDGTTVEEGQASHGAGNLWTYIATSDNDMSDGDRIAVIASDFPGNITEEEEIL
jgi:hypothetical protein